MDLEFKLNIIILGPTAVGKTGVSILLAEKLGGEIISADAFQVYRGMDIATAKPTLSQRERVPHHLVDILDLDRSYSAADFRARARGLIGEIRRRGRIPLIVGGSGLYLKALVDGLFSAPPADPAYRLALRRREEEEPGSLFRELRLRDPAAAGRIHPHNLKRVIRALEVFHRTGSPISGFQTQWEKDDAGGDFLLVGLKRGREDLYRRIDLRARKMFEEGLLEETAALLERGIESNRVAWQALGYREAAGCLRGELSRAEAEELLARNTRHYARRQLTWWRRDERIKWVEVKADEDVGKAVKDIMVILEREEHLVNDETLMPKVRL